MKKSILNYLFILSLLAFISCSGSTEKDKIANVDTTKVKDMTPGVAPTCTVDGELVLDMTNHVLSMNQFGREFTQFGTSFPLEQGFNYKSYIESVNFSNFLSVINSHSGSDASLFIRGIWVAYTLSADTSLKYYFIPVLSTLTNQNNGEQEFSYQMDRSDTSLIDILVNKKLKVFEINNNSLISTSDDDDLTRKAVYNWIRYTKRIRINESGSIRPYDTDKTSTDGRLVFFPYQELCSLYVDNNILNAGATIKNNEFLHIYPAAKIDGTINKIRQFTNLFCSNSNSNSPVPFIIDKGTLSDDSKVLYDILVSNKLYNESIAFQEAANFSILNFRGLAANYGQLCPTRCNSFKVVNRRITE